jgi:NAD dependent epimerase/dehydratase
VSGRVLVTGADGFIGSHVAEAMLDAGWDVRAFCLYTSNGTHGWLAELPADRHAALDVRLGDVRDERAVREAVRGCDLVLHLAALIAIPYSYEAPGAYVDTNVRGTLHVLEAARDHGVRVVNTSTSEVYGTPRTVPIREDHPLRGQSPYSATKIAADKLCESYALSFGTPVTTLRPFNTFGPRQSLRAVIPTVLGQLLAGAEEVRLGALAPRRDFTYVEDTAAGFVAMARAELEPGTTVQLGTGHAVSVGELVELCCEVTGRTDARVVEEAARVRPDRSEVQVLLSDPSLARERLRWTPRVALREGLARTADWLAGRVDEATAARYHR